MVTAQKKVASIPDWCNGYINAPINCFMAIKGPQYPAVLRAL
jgi:hypothetical protein